MGTRRFFVAVLLVGATIACDGLLDPCPVDQVWVTVTNGSRPTFDWTPQCGVAGIVVDSMGTFAQPVWGVETDPAAGSHPAIIGPSVRYGVVPPHAHETLAPHVLVAGVTYGVHLYLIGAGGSQSFGGTTFVH